MRRLLAGILLSCVLVACGDSDDGEPERRTLRVAAASSLTDAFEAIRGEFVADHEDIDVELSFASSSVIAQQVNELAPIDVVATADVRSMAAMVDEGTVDAPDIFAANRLTMIVEPGNPKRVASLADLATPGTVTVLCVETAPCGRYAAAALAKAGVSFEPASREENVKAVVAKVTLGEADAGIVYETDALAADDDVDAVAIANAGDDDLRATYAIAGATIAEDDDAAADWLAFVLSERGQGVLRRFGFLDT